MRLDCYLHTNGFFQSREKSRKAVQEGAVEVNGKVITKPSFEVEEGVQISIIKETNPYVGRGGLKLQGAIETFGLDLKGLQALDVGASTGGFTDCMLQYGAAFVCACDVGKDQLDPSLRNREDVLSLEETDIRALAANPEEYGITTKFQFASMDVSFISVTKVLPFVKMLMAPGAKLVCLVKPQFEVGTMKVGKKGVIRDPKVHKRVCDDVKAFALSSGYAVLDCIPSPITGGDGNIEFLALFIRNT